MSLPPRPPPKTYALIYEVDGNLRFGASSNDPAVLEARARELLEKGETPLAMVVQHILGFTATTRIEVKTHTNFHGGTL